MGSCVHPWPMEMEKVWVISWPMTLRPTQWPSSSLFPAWVTKFHTETRQKPPTLDHCTGERCSWETAQVTEDFADQENNSCIAQLWGLFVNPIFLEQNQTNINKDASTDAITGRRVKYQQPSTSMPGLYMGPWNSDTMPRRVRGCTRTWLRFHFNNLTE